MSRFKILILATFVSLPTVALLWSDPQYLANAHDGHEHKSDAQQEADLKGHDHKGHDHDARNSIEKSTLRSLDIVDQPKVPQSEPSFVPLNMIDDEKSQEQPAPTGPVQPKRNHGEQPGRPQDLHVIAIRLEYAVEIVTDEIDFDVHCYDRDDLLDAAHMLERRVQQFRDAIESGVDSQGLRLEFQRLTNSFLMLAHPLERHYGSILITRSMSRVDRLMSEVNRQLRNIDGRQTSQESHGEEPNEPDHSSFQSPAAEGRNGN